MTMSFRCLGILILFAVRGLLYAQISVDPGRWPENFEGSLPVIWIFEGRGQLLSASVTLRDEDGGVVTPLHSMTVRALGLNSWQAWEIVEPFDILRKNSSRQMIADWSLIWSDNGVSKPEHIEVPVRTGELRDGWLQRAYQHDELSRWSIDTSPTWLAGTKLKITLKGPEAPKKVSVQVVDAQSEAVLQSWMTLSLDKGLQWSLASQTGWPKTGTILWIAIEDKRGALFVISRELLGISSNGLSLHQKEVKRSSKIQPLTSSTLLSTPLGAPSTVLDATAWLNPLDESLPSSWQDSNRIAAVKVGYLDEERNGLPDPVTGIPKLWPIDYGRPISLEIMASDKLGKPLYSVNYLLKARMELAETTEGQQTLEAIARTALDVGTSNGSLPEGAKEVPTGHVLAPIVVSAGKIDDFLGRPLAIGFSWALHDNGNLLDAETWSKGAAAPPPVGLAAINKAALLIDTIIQKNPLTENYTPSEALTLSGKRDPFALSFHSQDPLGRVVVSKPLGSTRIVDSSATDIRPVKILTQPAENEGFDFVTSIPNRIKPYGHYDVNSNLSEPTVRLFPPQAVKARVRGALAFKNINSVDSVVPDYEDEERLSVAGGIEIAVGRLEPGGTAKLTLVASGRINAIWVVDGLAQLPISLAAPPYEVSFSPEIAGITIPVQLGIRFENATVPALAIGVDPTAYLSQVTSIQMSVEAGPLGLEAVDSILNQPVVAGYTKTQYGLVEVEGIGRLSVSMVTDPDGSGVAEVKDSEGRTIYKIVNPTSVYTTYFKDYQNNVFQPSSPKFRGPNGVAGNLPQSGQLDLVTQYLFDEKGHLRVVIPPLGKPSASIWGYNLNDQEVRAAFDWSVNFAGNMSSDPLPYATHNSYDDSGHLIATFNPDEGLTLFKVDQKGRVHYSQNATQRARNAWTHTYYDQIFRIVAVGETTTAPPLNLNTIGLDVVSSDAPESSFADMTSSSAYLSINRYDDYSSVRSGEDDPIAFFKNEGGNPLLSAILPPKVIWGGFSDGHLVQTYELDPAIAETVSDRRRTVERYFYDQDGRIVIRWVSHRSSEGSWRHFAIGIYYDFAGRVKRLVYPSGPGGDPLQVVYTYDELGRLFAVGTPKDKGYFARYAYQATGEIKAIIYGPGEGFAAKRMLQDPQGWLRSLAIQGR
jgi:hypothetical protein